MMNFVEEIVEEIKEMYWEPTDSEIRNYLDIYYPVGEELEDGWMVLEVFVLDGNINIWVGKGYNYTPADKWSPAEESWDEELNFSASVY